MKYVVINNENNNNEIMNNEIMKMRALTGWHSLK
jgi:hypothetical protein